MAPPTQLLSSVHHLGVAPIVPSHYLSWLLVVHGVRLFTGCWVAAMSPIFIHILGPDLLSSAFGLLTAIRGTACLVGPPLAGFAVDFFNNRLAAIVLSGVFMAASSLLFIMATLYSAWRDTRAMEVGGHSMGT